MKTWLKYALWLPASGLVSCTPPAASVPPKNLGPASVVCVNEPLSSEPDLITADPHFRASLATHRQDGLIAVRYEKSECGAHLEVLDHCTVQQTQYAYRPYPSRDSQLLSTTTELRAQLPLSAATLEGGLGVDSLYRFDYQLVGVAELNTDAEITRDRLVGSNCRNATHVVQRLFLGGFELLQGSREALDASVGAFGVGASSKSAREWTRGISDGDPAACRQALDRGREHPSCVAALRIRLQPVAPNLATAADHAAFRGDFDRAERLYLQFAKDASQTVEDRKKAARKAFSLAIGLERSQALTRIFELWDALHPDAPEERARLRLELVGALLDTAQIRAARRQLETLEASLPPLSAELKTLHWGALSRACATLGDAQCIQRAQAEAMAAFQSISAEWLEHLQARDPEQVQQLVSAVGMALYEAVRLEMKNDPRLIRPPAFEGERTPEALERYLHTQLTEWYSQHHAALNEYSLRLGRITEQKPHPHPAPVIRAAALLAKAWDQFVGHFATVPIPTTWDNDDELRVVFQDALENALEPFREQCKGAAKICLAHAAKFGMYNHGARECRELLAKRWPREYPPLPYFVPTPTHPLSGRWSTRPSAGELDIPFEKHDRSGWTPKNCAAALETINGNTASANLYRGLVHERCGRPVEALTNFDQAIAKNPGVSLAHVHSARLRFDLNAELSTGLQRLDAINRSSDQRSVPVLLALAELRTTASDFKGARSALERAAELQPENPEVIARITELFLAQLWGKNRDGLLPTLNSVEGAEPTARTALLVQLAGFAESLDGKSPLVTNAVGLAAAAHFNTAERALAAFRQAASDLRAAALPWVNLGALLLLNHNYAGAEKAFRDGLTADPRNFDATLGLGVARIAQGDLAEGVTLFKKCTQLGPDRAEGWTNLAWALSQQVGTEDSSQARERAWNYWLEVLREAYERLPPDYDRTSLETQVQSVRDRLQAIRDGEEAMEAIERAPRANN